MSDCKLRPHHGLCIRFFVGKGYSPEFTENMKKVIAELESGDPVLTLCTGADVICRACPNNICGTCRDGEKVAAFDNALMDLCGLEEGQEIRWSELTARVRKCVTGPGKRAGVCGSCSWGELCDSVNDKCADKQ